MISFPVAGSRFNHRAVGVCVDDGYVLLHRSVNDDFLSLPGGRIEIGEPSSYALRREMCEELGLEATVERLLWIVENFFTHSGVRHHELGMYYLISFQRDAAIYDKTSTHEGLEDIDLPLIFRWFPLDSLAELRILPTFLYTGLQDLPITPTHVVHIDTDE